MQNIVEGVSARFESQVLFVATGQSALTATPTLQKLTDRFAVQVALSDKDVETVVREVVLRKKPEHVPALKSDARRASAARSTGNSVARSSHPRRPTSPTSSPTTRCCLPAGDSGSWRCAPSTAPARPACCGPSCGSSTRPLRQVAIRPIGHVVGADFVYDEQAPGMLQSGVLLKEIDELIRGLRGEGRTAS